MVLQQLELVELVQHQVLTIRQQHMLVAVEVVLMTLLQFNLVEQVVVGVGSGTLGLEDGRRASLKGGSPVSPSMWSVVW